MKIRKLLILSAFLLVIASCKKDNSPTTPIDPVVTPPAPASYAITEGFESGSKDPYAAADVQLSTGTWNFNDALVGILATDVKNGSKAARIRTGDITMKFDVSGLEKIIISHAKFGKDATSTWQLMISDDGGNTFKQLGTDITETNTTLATDSFVVTTTKPVRFRIQKTGTTRIDIDDIAFKGKGESGIVITTPGDGDDDGDNGAGSTAPAAERGVVVGTDAPPATGDNSNTLLGNPSNAQPAIVMPDNYLIDQGYYTESYSSSRGTPNWVSWHLDATNTTNVSPRRDDFAGFIGLPNTFYHVESNSYSGSGFDRGHNCPSADRTSSASANSATFLMTNMIPQAPNNNQQTWANMENDLRKLVDAGNEIYIVMGSYGVGGTGSKGAVSKINNDKVTVPSNVWKIAVVVPKGDGDVSRVSTSTRVIAVNTPNINTTNSDWKQYRVTVRDIETATGYNLLSNLPQNIQDAVETKKDNL